MVVVMETETILQSTDITYIVSSPSISTPLGTSLYYTESSTGCFGLLTIAHDSASRFYSPTAGVTKREIARSFIRPTRLALSGDVSLSRLYSQPLQTNSFLPMADEVSAFATASLKEEYTYTLRRATPKVFILDEGDSTSLSTIYCYDPQTDELNLLVVGLKNASGLTCTPSSDLLFFEDMIVRRSGSTQTFVTTVVRYIPSRVIQDHAAIGEIIPPNAIRSLFPLPPSLIAGGLVCPLLLADGVVLVAASRRSGANTTVEGHLTARHKNAGDAGGVVVSFAPSLRPGSSPRENFGVGHEPSLCDRYDYAQDGSCTILLGDTCPLSDMAIDPVSGDLVLSGVGAGPLDPKSISIAVAKADDLVTCGLGAKPQLQLHNVAHGRAECVAVGGGGWVAAPASYECDPDAGDFQVRRVRSRRGGAPARPHSPQEEAVLPRGQVSAPWIGAQSYIDSRLASSNNSQALATHRPNSSSSPLVHDEFVVFHLSRDSIGTKLQALYSTHSTVARIIQTHRAAMTPIPETPRPVAPPPESEVESEGSVVSSVDDGVDEALFNDLSNALATEEGDRLYAERVAISDPSLKKDGPVNVKVVIRCRPLLKDEVKRKTATCVRCSRTDVTVDGSFLYSKADRSYNFDRVFGPEVTQRQVYLEVVAPIVFRVLDGFKCTVFAYGQTGSGKTYSMEGEALGAGGAEASGVIPRAVHTIFDELNRDSSCTYSVTASHMEIYLEHPYDLLASEESKSGGKWKAGSHMKHELTIIENTRITSLDELLKNMKSDDSEDMYAMKQTIAKTAAGVQVIGLSEVVVKKPADIFKIMHRTKQNRHSAETLCNRQSSRSHAIFSINVVVTKRVGEGALVTKRGRLHLVDLSGSESIKKSGAEGIHAVEAATIGRSLLSLGRVIRCLVSKDNHVPYRESKLTRILSDSLGGSSYTALILAITPNASMVAETMSTLSYGMLARDVTNAPRSDVKVTALPDKNGKAPAVISGVDDILLNQDGEITSLLAKPKEDDWKPPVVPWIGRVPVRKNPAGSLPTGAQTPIGNGVRSPRVFHVETAEWARCQLIEGGEFGTRSGVGSSASPARLSAGARKCFTDIFMSFDGNRDGVLNADEVEALDCTVGSRSGTPQAKEVVLKFERSQQSKFGNRFGPKSAGPKLELEKFLDFVTESAIVDPLAVRSMVTKGGYTLSFDRIGNPALEGIAGGTGGSNSFALAALDEEAALKDARTKKKKGSGIAGSEPKAASKSAVAYEAMEKIRVLAMGDAGAEFDLKPVFDKFDLDGSGSVDHDELRAVVAELCRPKDGTAGAQSWKIAKWEMDAIIELFDPNNDGSIDYGEFSWTFFNRRALVSKDAIHGDPIADAVHEEKATKKKKKKKDPDPVMPPPPRSGGFINLSDALNELMTVRVPGETDGSATTRRPLSALTVRDAVSKNRMEIAGALAASASVPTIGGAGAGSSVRAPGTIGRAKSSGTLNIGGATTQRGGGGAGEKKSAKAIVEDKPYVEKPRDWQEWVIKSRNTWMKTASRGDPSLGRGGMKDLLRGAGGGGGYNNPGGVVNQSHPKVPLLW